MRMAKKFVAIVSIIAMLGSSGVAISEEEQCEEGVAYYDSYGTSCLTPTIGLGVIAVAAIIAVAVNNTNRGHSHQ